MENTIVTRIYDFLKAYSPFQEMPKEVALALAAKAAVQYCTPEQVIFQREDAPHAWVYIVREGAVQLYHENNGERQLIEQCDEGDLFGIQPLMNDEPYLLTAIAAEESLIYGLRVEMLRNIAAQHPSVAFYFANSYAGDFLRVGKITATSLSNDNTSITEVQPVQPSRVPVTCPPTFTIQEAAQRMTQETVSSIIIVNELEHPIGIITDKDLRRYVATGQVSIEAPVTHIMSQPVITVSSQLTVADVQIEMVRHRIHHLCITADGTDRSPVQGVLSEHDLLVTQANNPAVLIRNIRRSRDAADLRRIREKSEALLQKYILQEVSIAYISAVMTEINDALTRRTIELAEAELQQNGWSKPEADYCWLALGSAGREEQLLRTDQDNALVFADVPADQYDTVKNYYLQLASEVTALLHECGFEYCPADMMASNPKWCLSLEQWKAQFSEWIRTPTNQAILYSTIFFDYRAVHGDISLARQLTAHIFAELDMQTAFLSFLANNALQNPPPLTFFRDFMVERSGEHKDEFDIKSRAMMPLCDAGRVLILHARVEQINNTFRRFEKLKELEPNNRELFEQAAEAYEVLMRYRTLQGLRNKDSGRFFKPSELTKMQRLQLRNSFRPIRELQSLLSIRFQLAFMR